MQRYVQEFDDTLLIRVNIVPSSRLDMESEHRIGGQGPAELGGTGKVIFLLSVAYRELSHSYEN